MSTAPTATTPAGTRRALESADVKGPAPAPAMLSVDAGSAPWKTAPVTASSTAPAEHPVHRQHAGGDPGLPAGIAAIAAVYIGA